MPTCRDPPEIGAHKITHCDLCALWDLSWRNPIGSLPEDAMTLVAIRRINRNAMWAREPEMDKQNLSCICRDYTDAITLYSVEDLMPYLLTHTVGY